MVRTTLAIILASTLSLSAYAADVIEATPIQNTAQQSVDTLDQNFYCDGRGHYRHHDYRGHNNYCEGYKQHGYHGHNTRSLERMLVNNPQYKEQVLKIESLRNSLYGERNVLKALMQASEPSAKEIRAQSQVVSQLKAKLQTEISDLHVKLKADKEFAKYFN